MFSAHNDHGSMKHEQKSFPESFSIRSSEGRAPASELVLRRGSLHIEIALQKGIPRVQNRISKGRSGLRKPKKYLTFRSDFFFKLIRNLNKKVGPFRLLALILLGGGGGYSPLLSAFYTPDLNSTTYSLFYQQCTCACSFVTSLCALTQPTDTGYEDHVTAN